MIDNFKKVETNLRHEYSWRDFFGTMSRFEVKELPECEINDVTTYNNGVITVPAYLCTPLVVDKDNLSVVKK